MIRARDLYESLEPFREMDDETITKLATTKFDKDLNQFRYNSVTIPLIPFMIHQIYPKDANKFKSLKFSSNMLIILSTKYLIDKGYLDKKLLDIDYILNRNVVELTYNYYSIFNRRLLSFSGLQNRFLSRQPKLKTIDIEPIILNEKKKALSILTDDAAKMISPIIHGLTDVSESTKQAYATILLLNFLGISSDAVINTILNTIVLGKLGLINENNANIWTIGNDLDLEDSITFLTVDTGRGLLILDMTPRHVSLSPIGFIPQDCYETRQTKEGTEQFITENTFFSNYYLDTWGIGKSHSYPIELSVFDQISLILGTN